MTAVAVPSPDLLRRLVGPVLAILLTALAVTLVSAAPAPAAAYCVKQAKVTECVKRPFKSLDEAFAAADAHPGPDEVIRLVEGKTTTTPAPDEQPPPAVASPLPKPEGPSVFDDITNFMLTWLP